MFKNYLSHVIFFLLLLSITLLTFNYHLFDKRTANLSIFFLYLAGSAGFLFFNFKENYLKFRTNQYVFYLLLGILCLYLSTYFISYNSIDFFEFEKRINLFMIPVLFVFIPLDLKRVRQLIHVFIGAFCLKILATFINVYFIQQKSLSIILIKNDMIWGERPYLGVLGSLCFAFSLHFLLQSRKYLYIFPILISSFFIIIVGAKLAFISLIVVSIVVFYWYFAYLNKNYKMFIFLFVATVFSLGFIFLNSSILKKRFDGLANKDERIFIWKKTLYCFSKADHHVVTGYWSEQKALKSLEAEYIKETQLALYNPLKRHEVMRFLRINNLANQFDTITVKNSFAKDEIGKYWYAYANNFNFNTHNQFFDFYLSYGILGLVVLFSFIGLIFYKAIQLKNIELLIVVTSMFLFMLTENIFSKEQGILMYMSFISMLIFCKENIMKEIKK